MSNKDSLTRDEDDACIPPIWLIHKLQLAGDYAAFTSDNQPTVSEQFRERSRENAGIAFTLNKLRTEREKIGFLPMSIADYLQGIAKVTSISLTSTLDWLGISDIRHPDPQSAAAFARLGLELGLSFSEILTHVRIAIAGSTGNSPILLLMARGRSGSSERNDLQVCISILDEVETKYDRSTLRDLGLIEAEIRAVYQQETQ